MKAPHVPITEDRLKEYGHIFNKKSNAYLNWNGVWLIKAENGWDYGWPNHYTIDEQHPFIKQGNVLDMDELDRFQEERFGRGLEYKTYKL